MADYDVPYIVTVPDIPTIEETLDTKTLPNYQVTVPTIPTIEETVDTKTLPNYQVTVPTIPTELSTLENVVVDVDPDYVFLHDVSVGYTDYTAEAREDTANDVPLLPSPIGAGDALYVGLQNNLPFIIEINQTTAGAGTYTISLTYWNGASWVSLSEVGEIPYYDHKSVDLVRSAWAFPSNAVAVDVNGQTAYWVKISYVSGTLTTQPLAGRIKIKHTPIVPILYSGRMGRGIIRGGMK